MTHLEIILKGLQDNFNNLAEVGEPAYPITISTHDKQGVHNVENVASDQLPLLFYGNGNTFENDSIEKPNTHRGETIGVLVNIVVEGDDLLKLATDVHEAVRMVVAESQAVGNSDTEDGRFRVRATRLRQRNTFKSKRFTKREMLVFVIEVDRIYPVVGGKGG